MNTIDDPKTALDWMFFENPIYQSYRFDRITIRESGKEVCSLLGIAWCEYASGPNLAALADSAAEVLGRSGYFGLSSARYRGFNYSLNSTQTD